MTKPEAKVAVKKEVHVEPTTSTVVEKKVEK